MSIQVSDSVIWQESASGVSLYHSETGDFRTLNETAAQIWILAANDGEREPIIAKLSLLFGGANAAVAGRIRADVDEFIDAMVESGHLVESVDA